MKGREALQTGNVSKRLLALGMAAAVVLQFTGCGSKAEDLMKGITSGQGENLEEQDSLNEQKSLDGENISRDYNFSGDGAGAVTDFAVRLLQQTVLHSDSDGDILISPLSVVSALAMTANGAKAETLSQMEEVFEMSVPELSQWLCEYRQALPADKKYKLSMANSIWFTADERFTVNQDFLQANADYFDAGVYKVPFDDETVTEINKWVKDNTDGMIPEILNQIPPQAVMYLINALAFDAEWQSIYREDFISEGSFAKEDGTIQKAKMMYSAENLYLTDGKAEGFIKYYADAKYAFAALLPMEDLTVSEYVASLTGEGLRDMLLNPTQVYVSAAIPKYEMEYNVEMNEILKEMGMRQAFDEDFVDLSGIGSSTNGNIYISKVIHKTYMVVDEKGTKAGAATAVETSDGGAMILEIKTVHLDRPFVCMILDCEEMVPVFIGVVMEVAE